MKRVSFFSLLCLISAGSCLYAQDAYSFIDSWLREHSDQLKALNQSIWNNPELGLQEFHAAAELSGFLEDNGFTIERGVAGMPTAFIATAGSGKPVIALLAEYDALPGLSQAAVSFRQPREDAPLGSEKDIGHGCGHSVFGVGSTAAAIAAWKAMKERKIPGTIRLYGTPAEETNLGKVYMVKAGLFADVDVALHWHISKTNNVLYTTSKALISVKFNFEGQAAHAGISPHLGHSALDAVELMNVAANYLREHLRQDMRMHYVITNGGGQPNVVPPAAEVWYYLRADDHKYLEYVYTRISEIAAGAAQMTRTKLSVKMDTDAFEILPNLPLSILLYKHFSRIGPPLFSDEERAFASRMQKDLDNPPQTQLADHIEELPGEPAKDSFSSDVGNVSWQVATGGIYVASIPAGLPSHSWYAVACTGMSIGEKAMLTAANCLASAAFDLMTDPELLRQAKEDFKQSLSKGNIPKSLLPENQKAPATIR